MTQLRKLSSETIYVQDVLLVAKGFTAKLFIWIFRITVIYEIFSIQNLLHIWYACFTITTYSYLLHQYLISDVHWDILPTDALRDYVEISTASSLEELFNIFSLKEM